MAGEPSSVALRRVHADACKTPQRAEHRRCFRDGLSFIIKSLKCGHVWEAISRKAARPKEKGKSGKTIKDEEQAGDKIM